MIRDVVSVRDRSRIHYRRLGQGPGMVLLHGYPQTGHMWRKVMPALAERFTVVAPDLRGYGDSDRPAAGYDKRTMAADVADVPGFEDYRAGATIDLEHDGADRDTKVAVPTLVLWGEAGGRRPQAPDMLAVWKERCVHVEGRAVLGSGHFIPEEQPAAVIDAILRFVGAPERKA